MAAVSIMRDRGHSWAYLGGAVCPAHGVGAGLVLPVANDHAMNEHFADISCHVAPGAHAVVILDGAGWRRAGSRLRVPHNISMLHPPPESPELNPAQNIW